MNDVDDLDPERVAFFAAQYAAQSDEELCTLKVTRAGHLVYEARFALEREMARRAPAGFKVELAEKAADLRTQAVAVAAQERQAARAASDQRLVFWGLGALGVLAGLAMGTFGDSGNFAYAVAGILLVVYVEARRFIGNVIHAMFKNGGRSD